jgi:ABC-type multidrug transport system permease subunit
MADSLQGLQNQLYAIFMLFTIFGNFCTQILPHFATQRTLYEARECPSKTYSWKVFILSNILVEIPWNSLMAVLIFLAWYYPIGLRQNAVEADKVAERGALMFLFILAFLIFAGTFSDMCVAAVDTAEAAGNIANLLFPRTLIFCGYVKSPLSLPFYLQPLHLPPHPRNIFEKPLLTQPPNVLATPTTLPGSWIFLYRISPLTYLVSGILSVGLANSHIACTTEEFLHFCSPLLSNCSTYLAPYIERFNGSFVPDSMNSTTECVFCTGSDTNIFLESVSAKYADRWRNFGIIWVYVGFNAAAAVGLYWLARVPKGRREKK